MERGLRHETSLLARIIIHNIIGIKSNVTVDIPLIEYCAPREVEAVYCSIKRVRNVTWYRTLMVNIQCLKLLERTLPAHIGKFEVVSYCEYSHLVGFERPGLGRRGNSQKANPR
jgi:hypothetical protein